ncbi:GntR family transcriptional regulator [Deinococcus sp. VB343]|uniref:GntR family transcriptional regulator n=1 Tax=Deinococcus sp. VB142 TaxID=3112952 RepID=A0AAU6Q665_9DEIO
MSLSAAPTADLPAWWVTLRPDDAAPAYVQLAQGLRQNIAAGKLRPGSALPAERELAARLGVSRVTLRQGLGLLEAEGLLRRRRGSGTFVAGPPASQQLGLLSSFSDEVRSQGSVPGARVLKFVRSRPTAPEALSLGLAPAEEVYRLRRLRTSDGEPLAIEESTLPAALIGPLSAADVTDASLYALLGERRLAPARAIRHLRAQNADPEQARLLGVEVGAALLNTERVSWLASGRPIEYARACYRGDRYDFVMELHGEES